MVDVDFEAKRIISEPMADKTRVREIKSLCAKVREEERERAKPLLDDARTLLRKMGKESRTAVVIAMNHLREEIAAYSPGIGPVQQKDAPRCKHGVWAADHCYQCSALGWIDIQKPEAGTDTEGR